MPVSPMESANDEHSIKVGVGTDQIEVLTRGTNELKSVAISTNRGRMGLDLESRSLQIGMPLTPAISKALETMMAAGNSLQNCEILSTTETDIELRYRG